MAEKSKASKALAAVGTRLRNTAAELESVKKLRSMDRKELQQLGTVAAVAGTGGAYAGYKIEEKIQTSEKISADSFLKKGVGGVPITTVFGAVGAFVAAKKLKGTKAVAASSFAGGVAGGAFIYKVANS